MTVEYVDGVKVMKLRDCCETAGKPDDGLALLHIWQLLTGGHSMRDNTVFCHRL